MRSAVKKNVELSRTRERVHAHGNIDMEDIVIWVFETRFFNRCEATEDCGKESPASFRGERSRIWSGQLVARRC
jgi:hypothetical protein